MAEFWLILVLKLPNTSPSSLHSEPLLEYTQSSVPKSGARRSYSAAPFPWFFDEELNGSTRSSHSFLAKGLCMVPGPTEHEGFANLAARALSKGSK